MAEVHPRRGRRKGGDPSVARRKPTVKPVNLADPAEAAGWLAQLREQIADAVAAGDDATRPLGQRDLGRRAARRAILDAGAALEAMLDAAEPRAR
jgi:hypothetical protein